MEAVDTEAVDPGILSLFGEWAVDHAMRHWGLGEDEAGATDAIRESYEIYHQEAPANAFADIDARLAPPEPRGA